MMLLGVLAISLSNSCAEVTSKLAIDVAVSGVLPVTPPKLPESSYDYYEFLKFYSNNKSASDESSSDIAKKLRKILVPSRLNSLRIVSALVDHMSLFERYQLKDAMIAAAFALIVKKRSEINELGRLDNFHVIRLLLSMIEAFKAKVASFRVKIEELKLEVAHCQVLVQEACETRNERSYKEALAKLQKKIQDVTLLREQKETLKEHLAQATRIFCEASQLFLAEQSEAFFVNVLNKIYYGLVDAMTGHVVSYGIIPKWMRPDEWPLEKARKDKFPNNRMRAGYDSLKILRGESALQDRAADLVLLNNSERVHIFPDNHFISNFAAYPLSHKERVLRESGAVREVVSAVLLFAVEVGEYNVLRSLFLLTLSSSDGNKIPTLEELPNLPVIYRLPEKPKLPVLPVPHDLPEFPPLPELPPFPPLSESEE